MGRFLNRGGRRVDSPRERALAGRVSDGLAADDSRGRPLVIRASPWLIETAEYLKAAAGPPVWSARLAKIERLERELRNELTVAYQECSIRCGDAEELAASWRAHLSELDLSSINDLIDKHNAYYPIEAGLRMQWPSGRYLLPRGIIWPLPHLTIESLLDRP